MNGRPSLVFIIISMHSCDVAVAALLHATPPQHARFSTAPVLCASSQQPRSYDADVLVVGGGASGLFSGIAAARGGASVLILESGSQPLRKVKISGGGRCNVMHDQSTWDARDGRSLLLQRYPRGAAELTGPLTKQFSPPETAEWFEAEGVALKREADGRVFPTTDDSSTVIDALLGAAERAGVELQLGVKVVSISRESGAANGGDSEDSGSQGAGATGGHQGFVVQIAKRGGNAGEQIVLRSPALILATGSTSHDLAEALGHEIAPLIPSLFSFRLRPGGMLDASLAGVSVPDAELSFQAPAAPASKASKTKGKPKGKRGSGIVSARGPLLVTHRGVSGPAALRLSSFGAKELSSCGYEGTLELNLVPSLTRQQAGEELGGCRARMPLKAVGNVNPFKLPKRLWAAVVTAGTHESEGGGGKASDAGGATGGGSGAAADAVHRVDPSTPWGQLSKQDLRALELRSCRAPLPFSGKDSNKDEFVTAGGVTWSSVDTKRMESKHVPGLFFAGELLDVDGVTGGHNFQSCWTTGYVAGNAAADYAEPSIEI